jgi:hypothetical protein
LVLPPTLTCCNTSQAYRFHPEIWSGKLVEKFYGSTVLAAISNTDYEGEIRTKAIRCIRTKPTIRSGLPADSRWAEAVGQRLDLLIDKGKYFNTILDDVMDIQSDLNLLRCGPRRRRTDEDQIDTKVLLVEGSGCVTRQPWYRGRYSWQQSWCDFYRASRLVAEPTAVSRDRRRHPAHGQTSMSRTSRRRGVG